jgi:uncharacterized membrane protein
MTVQPHSKTSDDRMELMLGKILRAGVVLASVLVMVGVFLLLRSHGERHIDYRVFHGEPTDLRSVAGIWRTASSLHARGVIQLGLLVLIATPVARVILAIVAFARRRDWLYTVIALVVLAILAFSLSGATSGSGAP